MLPLDDEPDTIFAAYVSLVLLSVSHGCPFCWSGQMREGRLSLESGLLLLAVGCPVKSVSARRIIGFFVHSVCEACVAYERINAESDFVCCFSFSVLCERQKMMNRKRRKKEGPVAVFDPQARQCVGSSFLFAWQRERGSGGEVMQGWLSLTYSSPENSSLDFRSERRRDDKERRMN